MLPLRLRKICARILWAMNMSPGQRCAIRGGLHEHELLEELALRAQEQGIDVSLSYFTDSFLRGLYERVPLRYLRRTSAFSLATARIVDNIITLERLENPAILKRVPHARFAAVLEGDRPIRRITDQRGVKWGYIGWPSKPMARHFGIRYSLLQKYILDGMLVPHQLLWQQSQALLAVMRAARWVVISDEWGSKLKLALSPKRKIMIADGFISDADLRSGDVGLNLPDGEIYTAPLESFGHGVLIAPKTMDHFTERPIYGMRLVFENGRLSLAKSSAEVGERYLKATIKRSCAVDRKKEKAVRTTNVAEFGIGLNPAISSAIGYTLTDEKIAGTVHVAIGHNKSKAYGGTNSSCLHWDFVSNKGVDVMAILPNKKEIQMIENGKIIKN